jgi:hypothetical protein
MLRTYFACVADEADISAASRNVRTVCLSINLCTDDRVARGVRFPRAGSLLPRDYPQGGERFNVDLDDRAIALSKDVRRRA